MWWGLWNLETYCYREEIRTKHTHPYSHIYYRSESLLVDHPHWVSVTLEEINEEAVPVPPNTPQDLTTITKLRPKPSRRAEPNLRSE